MNTPRTNLAWGREADTRYAQAHNMRAECEKLEVDLAQAHAAIRNLRDVNGRHHTQHAMERLFELLPENGKGKP